MCVAALAALAALAGCGGAAAAQDVGLLVTGDFGASVGARTEVPRCGGETVKDLLERTGTRFGPGARRGELTSVGGRRGLASVHVNGVAAQRGLREPVHPGDRVWIDVHDRRAVAPRPAAVVGSFPAPFTTGLGADRVPTRVECVEPGSRACRTVTQTLVGLGVPAGSGAVGNSRADETLRVLVGPWVRLRSADEASGLIAAGPARSGVYARFSPDARSLQVLDARGRRARSLEAGTGLIAATRVPTRVPVWFVTGTDAAGVRAAARAFGSGALVGRPAVALAGGRAVRLPPGAAGRGEGPPNP